jgi:hypothetical protein
VPIRREAFDVVLFVFSDTRELIAAGKVQRWDVLKWTVTVNIGLAAAAATLRQSYPNSGWAFFICAVATGALGLGLILYYNRRMTRARERLRAIHKFIRESVVNLKETVGLEYGMEKNILRQRRACTVQLHCRAINSSHCRCLVFELSPPGPRFMLL